jgi:hypothetical protein
VDGVRAVPLLADEERRSPSEPRAVVLAERRAESGRTVLAVADADARGRRSVCPGWMVSLSMSFASRTASTVTSYFRAIPHSDSPSSTVCVRADAAPLDDAPRRDEGVEVADAAREDDAPLDSERDDDPPVRGDDPLAFPDEAPDDEPSDRDVADAERPDLDSPDSVRRADDEEDERSALRSAEVLRSAELLRSDDEREADAFRDSAERPSRSPFADRSPRLSDDRLVDERPSVLAESRSDSRLSRLATRSTGRAFSVRAASAKIRRRSPGRRASRFADRFSERMRSCETPERSARR